MASNEELRPLLAARVSKLNIASDLYLERSPSLEMGSSRIKIAVIRLRRPLSFFRGRRGLLPRGLLPRSEQACEFSKSTKNSLQEEEGSAAPRFPTIPKHRLPLPPQHQE